MWPQTLVKRVSVQWFLRFFFFNGAFRCQTVCEKLLSLSYIAAAFSFKFIVSWSHSMFCVLTELVVRSLSFAWILLSPSPIICLLRLYRSISSWLEMQNCCFIYTIESTTQAFKKRTEIKIFIKEELPTFPCACEDKNNHMFSRKMRMEI